MLRRARSLSRFRGTTPGRETTPSIYDYGSNNENYEKGSFSTRPNLYTPDVYGSVSRSVRAVSVARSKDIDDEILGPLSNKITGSFNQYQRGQSIGRFDHLKARRPYSAYSTHDFDYFDRYTERIRDKTPIALDSHYTHYRPYYWYHTAPRTFYYSFPYDDWRYRPLTATRSSSYSSPFGNSSYNYRFNDSIDRVSSMKRAMRDLDYTRELRQLRFPTSSSYLSITQGDSLLNRARDEVRRTIDTRVSSSGISRLNNPRDYFGRTVSIF